MIIFFSAKTDRFVHFAQFQFSKASRNIDRKKLLIFCDFQNDLISAVLRMDENSVFRYNLMEKEGDSMPRKKKEKFVSDFVTIDDVCSCGVTAIWSGVGSGKNGFIEGVHEEIKNNDGTTTNINVVGLAEKYRVLLITSRIGLAKICKLIDINKKQIILPYICLLIKRHTLISGERMDFFDFV